MPRIHPYVPALAAIAALAVAGCGESGSRDHSPGSALANLASPGSLVFVEAKLKPTGKLKSDVDAIAKRLTAPFDFAKEGEPWLGERGAVAFERLVGGELSEPLIAVQTTEPHAAQAFVERQTAESNDNAIGLIGDALVLAGSEKEFKAAVDASKGDSLGDEDRFQEAIAAASDGSFADVYVDVGAMLEQSEGKIDPRAREVLRSAGINPSDATAVASVIPQSEQIEVDLSSDFGEQAPAGDRSKLLGALPASSLAAFAFSEFSEQLKEAIDNLDELGAPPDLKPDELGSTLKRTGIDLDQLAGSLEGGAVFVEGSNRKSLGGALVLSGNSGEAAAAVGSLGVLLRGAGMPGVTAVSGKASGFSIRSEELGDKPVVVVGKGNRVAIGYGMAPALAGLSTSSTATLSGTPDYQAAVASLGKTPISAFVDGPAALSLAEALVPRSSRDFWEAVPYLKKISYIGIGTRANGELATAKLIAGVSG